MNTKHVGKTPSYSTINDEDHILKNPYADGDQDEIIPEEDLPFTRFKLPPEEEDAKSIRTVQAWVVDVPDPRHITTLMKWLKQAGLDGPALGHLKRIKKQGDRTSFLLSTTSESPELPADLNFPTPYMIPVPSSSALTMPSLALKSVLWPTMYTPRRKDEPEPWSRRQVRWAWDALKTAVNAAIQAQTDENELPIAAHIPAPFHSSNEDTGSTSLAFTASDTRNSTRHPLRHATLNAVRKLADHHASSKSSETSSATSETANESEVRNGSNYLLTDQTFFITHEPCIMCSMALLHSRVKEVVFLYPMPRTGGCGGSASLPTLKGVNHRFAILQWKLDNDLGEFYKRLLDVDRALDA